MSEFGFASMSQCLHIFKHKSRTPAAVTFNVGCVLDTPTLGTLQTSATPQVNEIRFLGRGWARAELLFVICLMVTESCFGLGFVILLPQPPKCRDYRSELPHLSCACRRQDKTKGGKTLPVTFFLDTVYELCSEPLVPDPHLIDSWLLTAHFAVFLS